MLRCCLREQNGWPLPALMHGTVGSLAGTPLVRREKAELGGSPLLPRLPGTSGNISKAGSAVRMPGPKPPGGNWLRRFQKEKPSGASRTQGREESSSSQQGLGLEPHKWHPEGTGVSPVPGAGGPASASLVCHSSALNSVGGATCRPVGSCGEGCGPLAALAGASSAEPLLGCRGGGLFSG